MTDDQLGLKVLLVHTKPIVEHHTHQLWEKLLLISSA